ncbi:hypothetical protein PA598K_06611 [Paenibacillus sp. 598K]|uniref:DUF6080 domain-containing protein n=1 Tax=Paenibacillus sp. 598K TaxID=1117987 RepID=UPI000FF95B4F|nr:DUF6080 domain-containing protein [Paenibacillus sp. 598K]GBF78014.1 hypothetical protein PA598K_06611 [Paenibacillus sp. 598K]
MSFWHYLWRYRTDNWAALILFLALTGLYIAANMPYVQFMTEHDALLQQHSPFYGAPFTLNLFNFDPSMYYPAGAPTIIHPVKDLLAVPLAWAAGHLGGLMFFLVVQSAINAASAVLLFYGIRRSGGSLALAGAFGLWLGVSSYSLFTALIPDSYPYVQLLILWSVLYLQYARSTEQGGGLWPQASLAAANFAITSTNVATFMAGVFINLLDGSRRFGALVRRFLLIGAAALGLALLLTGVQWLLFGGSTWLTSWRQGLSDGGFSYVASFSWAHHWQAFYMLFINPVFSPVISYIDPGLAAFVTDLGQTYPLYVQVLGWGLIALALLGLYRGRRSRESWILAVYIGFALLLHLVVGFGLGAFQYDMYLYAGHSLFAIFLLAAAFLNSLAPGRLRQLLVGLVWAAALVALVHNLVRHAESLDTIRDVFLA